MGAFALLIGVSDFADPRLAKLNAPCGDVEALAQVLRDPARGNFDSVATCIDQDFQTIRKQITKLLLDDRSPSDLVLLYYSGHGIISKGQRLFLATGQSSFDLPAADSLSALEMRDWLEQSRAGRQIIILDCCHSGAFIDGAKGVAQTITDDTFGSDNAEGQYILTATDSLQFAYDANGTLREGAAPAALSHFTGWLVDAIGKGAAAPDSERITLDAVFEYLSRRAREEAIGMTPKRFVKRNSGEMVISRNPSAKPMTIPDELLTQLASSDWQVRKDAVVALGKIAKQPPMGILVKKLVRERVRDERDLDVSDAMYEVLAQLGRARAPDQLTIVPGPNRAEPEPVSVASTPITAGLQDVAPVAVAPVAIAENVSVFDPPENPARAPVWRQAKWAAVAVLLLAIIGGIYLYTLGRSETSVDRAVVSKSDVARMAAQSGRAEFKDCETCPAMIPVAAGRFIMGSPSPEPRSLGEGPQHQVTIPHSFAVGKYEVTFAEWDACVADGGCGGYSPDDQHWGRGNHPVINVNWNDAQSYVRWLSGKTSKQYRLLSESEWEYAARAGTTTAFYWGDTPDASYANYLVSNDGNGAGTVAVGSYLPNAFGLYDMLGNVQEWTQDCFHDSYAGAPTDGSAWTSGDCNVRDVRGGSWGFLPARFLRSGSRNADSLGTRRSDYGFRVARTL